MATKTHSTNRDRHADLGRRSGWTVTSMPVLVEAAGGLTSLVMVHGTLKLGVGYTVCMTDSGPVTRVHRVSLTGDGRDRYWPPSAKMVESIIADHGTAPARPTTRRRAGQ